MIEICLNNLETLFQLKGPQYTKTCRCIKTGMVSPVSTRLFNF